MIRSPRLFLYLLPLSALLVFGSLPGRVLAAEASAAATDARPSPKVVVDIPVDGMACVACAASVKSAVKALPGVVGVEVNLENRNARVTYFASLLTPSQIVAAIDKLGYTTGMPQGAP